MSLLSSSFEIDDKSNSLTQQLVELIASDSKIMFIKVKYSYWACIKGLITMFLMWWLYVNPSKRKYHSTKDNFEINFEFLTRSLIDRI
jgi:hypothetical protein